MSEPKSPKSGLTRRSFLKATGAVGGLAAIGALSACSNDSELADTGSSEQVFANACLLNCPNKCTLCVHVRDGKAYKVTRNENVEIPETARNAGIEYDRYPCLRGRTLIQTLYDPNRIQYPMRRVEGTERGAGKWERISWEEAIDYISEKFLQLQKEYGSQSIAMPFLTGSGSVVNGWYGAPRLFANVTGATDMEYALDEGWSTGDAYVTGNPYDGDNAPWDLKNARTIFVWGANATESRMRVWRWIQFAREGGSRVVCVDPRYTISASKSDVYVPIQAGTDGALALGIIKYLIDGNQCDTAYMLEKTCAPFLVKEDGSYLHGSEIGLKSTKETAGRSVTQVDPGSTSVDVSGYDPIVVWDANLDCPVLETECENPALSGCRTIEGIKLTTAYDRLKERVASFTPDKVADICNIDASYVSLLGEMFAEGPCAIVNAYGFDHYNNGDTAAQALYTLMSVTGNLGVVGGGMGEHTSGTGMFMMDAAWIYPDEEHFAPVCTYVCVPEVLETGQFMGAPFPIKAFFCLNSNGFSNNVDQKRFLEELLPKLELVVTADITMTDTARYSDVVLPATHWFENDDLMSMCDFMELCERAVEPQFEAKSNLDLLQLLADKMGVGEYFAMSAEEVLRHCFETTPGLADSGVTFDLLKEKKVLLNVVPDLYDGINPAAWGTQSGKLEFYNEMPSPRMDVGLNPDMTKRRLADFVPPAEAWRESELFERYPLIFFQEHSRWRLHSQFCRAPWLRELDPEPVVKLNAYEASNRGIQSGDVVEVFNDRGSVVVRAVVSNDLPNGMVNIPKGWQRDQFIRGCYQELTPSRYNESSLNQEFFDVLVEVRRVDE